MWGIMRVQRHLPSREHRGHQKRNGDNKGIKGQEQNVEKPVSFGSKEILEQSAATVEILLCKSIGQAIRS